MRSMRFICRLALPVVVLVGAAAAAGPAGAQSPDVQTACTPDAMRLCGQFIPDRDKVTACMKVHRREWSEACRTASRGEHVARGHTRHHVRHERHHHKR